MSAGTVKWFDSSKGFGFITPDDGGKDLFLHHSAVESAEDGAFANGQRVEFDSEQGPKGPQAARVRPL